LQTAIDYSVKCVSVGISVVHDAPIVNINVISCACVASSFFTSERVGRSKVMAYFVSESLMDTFSEKRQSSWRCAARTSNIRNSLLHAEITCRQPKVIDRQNTFKKHQQTSLAMPAKTTFTWELVWEKDVGK
jgi:hypothetical protein